MHINIKKVITISRRIKISKDIGYKYLSLRYPSSAVLNIGLLLSNAFLEEKWSTHFNQIGGFFVYSRVILSGFVCASP